MDPSPRNGNAHLSQLLANWNAGDADAGARVMALLYPELKLIAERRMRHELFDHTWQPTALVHELFLQFACNHTVQWKSRAHFLAVASKQMRQILVDYARLHNAQKRGGGEHRLKLDDIDMGVREPWLDILEINEVLDRLAEEEPRMAKVVEMRCFGGLTHREIGEVLGMDERTAKRDWQVACAWLHGQLHKDRK